jgi:hypothetical protein
MAEQPGVKHSETPGKEEAKAISPDRGDGLSVMILLQNEIGLHRSLESGAEKISQNSPIPIIAGQRPALPGKAMTRTSNCALPAA